MYVLLNVGRKSSWVRVRVRECVRVCLDSAPLPMVLVTNIVPSFKILLQTWILGLLVLWIFWGRLGDVFCQLPPPSSPPIFLRADPENELGERGKEDRIGVG